MLASTNNIFLELQFKVTKNEYIVAHVGIFCETQ